MSLFRQSSPMPTARENDLDFMERAKTRISSMVGKGVVTQSEVDELRVRFGIVFRDLRPVRRGNGEAYYRADQVAHALATGDVIQNRLFIPSHHSVG